MIERARQVTVARQSGKRIDPLVSASTKEAIKERVDLCDEVLGIEEFDAIEDAAIAELHAKIRRVASITMGPSEPDAYTSIAGID